MLINVIILLRYKNKKTIGTSEKILKKPSIVQIKGPQYIENEWLSYVNWQA